MWEDLRFVVEIVDFWLCSFGKHEPTKPVTGYLLFQEFGFDNGTIIGRSAIFV
jgi:hypothetical protein